MGNSDVVSIDELDTDKDSVTLKAEGGYLKYKLGSSARWENFSGSPAIYIVYNEPASYLKITNNTDKDYSYRITIYSGNYTKPILLKTENGYERLEVSENSTHYELNIKKGSSDTICVLNAVDMHYNVQVLDEEGNTVSTNGYRQLGFELEEDSAAEFGQLINGPEFEGSDSFTSAEESGEFINIKYCDIRIPAPTNYKGNKEPFIMAMIISLLMIATALLIRNKRNEERENEKPRLAGKENNL